MVALGIPVREAGTIVWGGGLPAWLHVRAAWNRRCDCANPPDCSAWLCLRCNGTRPPSPGAAAEVATGVCRWCATPAEMRCPACGQGVHFMGQCRRWSAGASRAYSPDRDEDRWLCPDCTWVFVQALGEYPQRVRPAPVQSVAGHMVRLAGMRCQGAGREAAPEAQVGQRVRNARRWILRWLETRGWASRHRIRADAAPQFRGAVVEAAIGALEREDMVWTAGRGRDASVHRRRLLEHAAPGWTRHRRRRRSSDMTPGVAPPCRRRRVDKP